MFPPHVKDAAAQAVNQNRLLCVEQALLFDMVHGVFREDGALVYATNLTDIGMLARSLIGDAAYLEREKAVVANPTPAGFLDLYKIASQKATALGITLSGDDQLVLTHVMSISEKEVKSLENMNIMHPSNDPKPRVIPMTAPGFSAPPSKLR